MLLLAAFLAVLAAGVAGLLRVALLRNPPEGLAVRNYRGALVPAVGGAVIVLAVLAGETVLALAALAWPNTYDPFFPPFPPTPTPAQRAFLSPANAGLLLLGLGFFALGLLDDVAGAGRERGLAGHLRALAGGAVTGGAIKALGGGALAFLAGAFWERSLGPAILDGLVVALAANLVNLLDLRPGRAIKGFAAVWTPLVILAPAPVYLALSAPAAAAAAVWLPADLRERGMLGDAGSNLLGGVAGAGLALSLPTVGKLVALAVLIGLTGLSERLSFSAAIGRIGPLRWVDRLGRLPEEAPEEAGGERGDE